MLGLWDKFMGWYQDRMMDILPEYKELIKRSEANAVILNSLGERFSEEMKKIERDIAFYKSLVATVGDTIPDMMWAKDVDGKYLYANKHIKEGLLFDPFPEGKTDVELACRAKQRFGENNHTFGTICGNSDVAVLGTLEEGRFLEYGKVKGKMLYLEVYKAPLFIEGVLVGTCGTGRDMTEYVQAFEAGMSVDCDTCEKMEDIFAKYRFDERY